MHFLLKFVFTGGPTPEPKATPVAGLTGLHHVCGQRFGIYAHVLSYAANGPKSVLCPAATGS